MAHEKQVYKVLGSKIPNRKKHDRWDRVENLVTIGMPDINFCFNGVEGWIEVKSIVEPKNKKTRAFTGHAHKVSQAQKNWFLKQRNANGQCFLIVETDKRWMCFEGDKVDEITDEMTILDLVTIADWYAEKPVAIDEWAWLRNFLAGVI